MADNGPATIETSTVAVAAASPPPAPSPCAASLASLWQALQSPPSTRAAHLGEALVMRSLLTPDLLAHALETQRQSLPHRLLGQMLVDAGVVTESQLDTTLAEWLGVRVVDARTLVPEAEALRRVPRPVAEREGVLPLMVRALSLIHISQPTRPYQISYAVFCFKKKKRQK